MDNKFKQLLEHIQLLQQNALKVINPQSCSPRDKLDLEIISVLTSVIDYLKEREVFNEELATCQFEANVMNDAKIKLNQTERVNVDNKQVEKKEETQEKKENNEIKDNAVTKDGKDIKYKEVPLDNPVPQPSFLKKHKQLSMGKLTQYYEELKKWTKKSEASLIYEGCDLTSKSFWEKCSNLKNMMIVVETTDGYMFGSYHTVLPKTQDVWVDKDDSHFVFTLKNPYSINPTMFEPIPENDNRLFVYGDNDNENVVWVNYCYWICADNTAYLWHHFADWYNDTTELGGNVFTGGIDWDNPVEIENVYILEWI